MPEINFLSHRQKKLNKLQKRDLLWSKWAAGALTALVLVFILSIGLEFWFSQRLKALGRQQQAARQGIISNEQQEKTYVLAVQKLKTLAQLNKRRSDKQAAIAYFTGAFGPEVLVKQIAFAEDDQLLTFELSARDVFVFEQVLKQLKTEQVQQQFHQITPSDIRRSSDGRYEMKVAVVLTKAGG